MLITSEQAQKRLQSPDNVINKVERVNSHFELRNYTKGGRSDGERNLTEDVRLQIATEAQIFPAEEVAQKYGISRQHVQNLKFGRVGARAGDEKNHPDLKTGLAARKADIQDVALQRLMSSLGLLNEEKLENLDGKELSAVSSNLSKVVSNMSPKEASDNSTKIVIYAPQVKELEKYEVVDI